MPTRFDAVSKKLLDALDNPFIEGFTGRVAVTRDLQGRVRIFAEGKQPDSPPPDLCAGLRESLGNAMPSGSEICWVPKLIFDQLREAPGALQRGANTLIDQMGEGREWLMPTISSGSHEHAIPPRFVFYGFKGGVGRSSALAMSAWNFARQGKKVLVLDLDLESPGLGPLLLPTLSDYANEEDTVRPGWPRYGLVDWFVEDAIGQADRDLLEEMVQLSPLATRAGQIYVVPGAGGGYGQYFVSKLSRALIDVVNPQNGNIETFGDRLARAIQALEQKIHPDIVLLDSRAGLHSIAASLLSRLEATCLVFAADSAQTWAGLDHLFSHWQSNPQVARRIRGRLKVVNPLALNLDESALRLYREHSRVCFERLYDTETTEQDQSTTFNFNTHDEDAPHAPITVRYALEYARFAPLDEAAQVDEARALFVFGELFTYLDRSVKYAETGNE